MKWSWADHINRLKDDRWTPGVTTWGPYDQKNDKGEQPSDGETSWVILERHDLAESRARLANLEAAC